METPNQITLLLREVDAGRPGAMDDLMRIVYQDLERMAAGHLRRQFGDRAPQVTLEPSALVNESFLRLVKQRSSFDNRRQFFAIATRIMLRVLIDYRRARSAGKRGGDCARFTLSLAEPSTVESSSDVDLIDIEQLAAALEALERLDDRKADIVKMRVVWGMTVPEVAHALQVSPSSVDRDWRFAKAWIADEVGLTDRTDQPGKNSIDDA